MSDLGWKVKDQIGLWYLSITIVSLGYTYLASIMILALFKDYWKNNFLRFFSYVNALVNNFDIDVK